MKYLLLFILLFSCQPYEEIINEEEIEIELTIWIDKPVVDGYYRVKYDENKISDYCVVEYETTPLTRVFWFSTDFFCVEFMYQMICEPIVNYSTYSNGEDGSGRKLVYLYRDFIGDTLEVMGYINENVYKTIEFIVE
jgi:hypothetical protein